MRTTAYHIINEVKEREREKSMEQDEEESRRMNLNAEEMLRKEESQVWVSVGGCCIVILSSIKKDQE